jgi:hypothetical protein
MGVTWVDEVGINATIRLHSQYVLPLHMASRALTKFSTIFCLAMAAGLAHAGFDGWFVVSAVNGTAQIRTLVPQNGRMSWTPWRALKVGDSVAPPSEVRTLAHSTASLHSGVKLQFPEKMRADERVDTTKLSPNTLVRTNPAQARGPNIFIVERGKVSHSSEHGKLPPWQSPGLG